MSTFGQTKLYTYNELSSWRLFGQGTEISLGPLTYVLYSIELATITGIGFLIALFLLLQKGRFSFWKAISLLSLVLFVVILSLVAARGATISILIGALVLIVLMRWGDYRIFIYFALAIGLVMVFQDVLWNWLPSQTVDRFQIMSGGVSNVVEYQYRLNVISTTWQGVKEHPLGVGYDYLRLTYGLDESIVYSSILNGTGIIGALGYVLLMLQFLQRFLSHLRSTVMRRNLNYPALGLAIWLYGILNGFVSTTMVKDPVIIFAFWATLIIIYHAISPKNRKIEDQENPLTKFPATK